MNIIFGSRHWFLFFRWLFTAQKYILSNQRILKCQYLEAIFLNVYRFFFPYRIDKQTLPVGKLWNHLNNDRLIMNKLPLFKGFPFIVPINRKIYLRLNGNINKNLLDINNWKYFILMWILYSTILWAVRLWISSCSVRKNCFINLKFDIYISKDI